MNRRITKLLTKTLIQCFSGIEEFTLTKKTQLKLVQKCKSLFEERDRLNVIISKYKQVLNAEDKRGGNSRHTKRTKPD